MCRQVPYPYSSPSFGGLLSLLFPLQPHATRYFIFALPSSSFARLRLLTSRTRTTAFQRKKAKKIKVSLPFPLLFSPSLQKRPQKVLLCSFFPRASAPSSLSSSPLALRRQTEEEAIGEGAADEGSHGKTEGERERERREGSRGRKGDTKGGRDAIAKRGRGDTPFLLPSFLPPSLQTDPRFDKGPRVTSHTSPPPLPVFLLARPHKGGEGRPPLSPSHALSEQRRESWSTFLLPLSLFLLFFTGSGFFPLSLRPQGRKRWRGRGRGEGRESM